MIEQNNCLEKADFRSKKVLSHCPIKNKLISGANPIILKMAAKKENIFLAILSNAYFSFDHAIVCCVLNWSNAP